MPVYPLVNLQVIKPNRRKNVRAGTIFTYLLPNNKYGFGLVVKENVLDGTAPMESADLLFFYSVMEESMLLQLDKLVGDLPLIAPVWSNRMAWTKGYFISVGEVELSAPYLPTTFCFFDDLNRMCVDEYGRGPVSRTEPCGTFGLVSYRWIDDRLSDAIGWPRVSTVG